MEQYISPIIEFIELDYNDIVATSSLIEKRSIAVLGMTAAGKTTLYNQMRNIPLSKTYEGTIKENIPSFELHIQGRKFLIQEGVDIGGSLNNVYQYKDLVKESNIIFFLFDISKYLGNAKYRQDTNDRIDWVHHLIKSNQKVVYLGTHYDEIKKLKKRDDLLAQVLSLNEGKVYTNSLQRNLQFADTTSKTDLYNVAKRII